MWILPPVRQAKAQIKKILGAISLSNGRLVDSDGNFIAPYEFTMAQFATLVSSDWTGIDIVITDRHINSQGVGGLRVRGGSKWTLRDPQVYSATRAQNLTDFPAASYPGWRIFSADYGSYGGGYEVSDGTYYNTERETIVYRNPSPSNVLTQPGVQPDAISDQGGFARISFPSTHGITSGVAIPGGGLPNSQLYVTTTANGWTAGTWITITAVSDTAGNRYFDTDAAYAGKSGPPTIAIVTGGVGTLVTMRSVTVPPLSANGGITIEALTAATVSANNKNLTIKLGGTALYSPTFNSATNVAAFNNCRWGIMNVGSRTSQKGNSGSAGPFGIAFATSGPPGTSAIDTSGNTTLTFNWQPAAVNERMYFDSMTISVRP